MKKLIVEKLYNETIYLCDSCSKDGKFQISITLHDPSTYGVDADFEFYHYCSLDCLTNDIDNLLSLARNWDHVDIEISNIEEFSKILGLIKK